MAVFYSYGSLPESTWDVYFTLNIDPETVELSLPKALSERQGLCMSPRQFTGVFFLNTMGKLMVYVFLTESLVHCQNRRHNVIVQDWFSMLQFYMEHPAYACTVSD